MPKGKKSSLKKQRTKPGLQFSFPVSSLVLSITSAVDATNPVLADHHKRVAYICHRLCQALKIDSDERNNILIAALLHDMGAFSLTVRKGLLQFDQSDTRHSEIGYLLLKSFTLFSDAARIVRYHHRSFELGFYVEDDNQLVPRGSHILFLADRVAVLIHPDEEILGQVNRISAKINEQSGKMFNPKDVEAFNLLAKFEFFWLDTVSKSMDSTLAEVTDFGEISFDDDICIDILNFFRRMVDYRSNFTATHSAGVAACAERLSELAGFLPEDSRKMRIAGYLHDLGKLVVPNEILDKPAQLDESEFNVMRRHTYYTDMILRPLTTFAEIRAWASNHHERLDGDGYPFHIGDDKLTQGARIMAVADVFVALTEDRPYRAGMTAEQTLGILLDKAAKNHLDRELVELARANFDDLNRIRVSAQTAAKTEFTDLMGA